MPREQADDLTAGTSTTWPGIESTVTDNKRSHRHAGSATLAPQVGWLGGHDGRCLVSRRPREIPQSKTLTAQRMTGWLSIQVFDLIDLARFLHSPPAVPITGSQGEFSMAMNLRKVLLAAAASVAVGSTSAATVTWTDWTSLTNTATSKVATGTMGGYGVTVTASALFGPMNQLQGPGANCLSTSRGSANFNYWQEPNAADKPYTGGTVDNAPTACEQISLNAANNVTISFTGGPVQNLYMALVSVGQSGIAVTYDFDQAFVIDSEGEGVWGNDATNGFHDTVNHSLTMREFHGMLRFSAPVTSLSFTTRPGENWHAFTIGTVPAPGTLALASLALLAGAMVARRRRSA